MIDLYMYYAPHGLRVSVLLEELGLPYRVHEIDIKKDEHKTPEFIKLNPASGLPVVVDPDGPGGKPITLSQSAAIMLYYAQKAGKFIPTDPGRRARAFQWFMHTATDVMSSTVFMYQYAWRAPDKTEKNKEWLESRLVRHLSIINQHLADHEYFADEISLADLILYPTYVSRKSVLANGNFDGLHRWAALIGARPAVRRGMTCLVPTSQ